MFSQENVHYYYMAVNILNQPTIPECKTACFKEISSNLNTHTHTHTHTHTPKQKQKLDSVL